MTRIRTQRYRIFVHVITSVLVVINVTLAMWIYILQQSGSFNVIGFGASWAIVVSQHQWWRLLTALFVHPTWSHLAGNMIELWLFGNRIGLIYGVALYLFIYGFSGCIAMFATILWHRNGIAFGASVATEALLGALITYYVARRSTLSRTGIWKLVLLIIYAAIALIPDLIHPNFGAVGHPAGFMAGVILGIILLPRENSSQSRMPDRLPVRFI